MKKMKLQDCCIFISDGDHQAPPKSDEGVPFITISNITPNNKLDFDNVMHVPIDYYENITDEKKAKENDILYSVVGSFGKPVLINKNIKFVFQRHIAILRPNTDKVMPEFLYFYMLNPRFYAIVDNLAIGAAQRTLSLESLRNIEIELPSLDNQKKMVDIINPIEEKIRVNMQINDYLEQQALLIFRNMFYNISYGSNHVGDYITPRRGKVLLSKDAIPGCVPVIAGGLVPATYHNVSNTAAPVLTISGSGANAGYINIWYDSVWSSDSSYIDSDMTSNVYFWYAFLKSRQQDIFDIQTGSAQPHIYPKHIAELSIGDVDDAKVNSYTSQVTPLFAKIGANIRENNKLKQLRDWLLPMLMNGQATIED